MSDVPFIPANGRVLVRQLPYRPSKTIELIDGDFANENEGIVVALSPFRYGRKKGAKGAWEHTGDTFPHEVKVGDRVLFPGSYQDEDTIRLNGIKHRCLDSWDLVGILTEPQPVGFDNPMTGEKIPDAHPIHVFGQVA